MKTIIVLRALTAVEVCTHPEWYDESAPDCVNPLLYVKEIVFSVYSDLCHEIAGIGESCDITAVPALSSVIGYLIHTFWPPLKHLAHCISSH